MISRTRGKKGRGGRKIEMKDRRIRIDKRIRVSEKMTRRAMDGKPFHWQKVEQIDR